MLERREGAQFLQQFEFPALFDVTTLGEGWGRGWGGRRGPGGAGFEGVKSAGNTNCYKNRAPPSCSCIIFPL